MTALQSFFVTTPGPRLHVLAGGEGATVVCLVHGNLSTARFFEPLAADLPPSWRVIAPDLRGFGRSEAAPVNATRGLGDFADDVARVLAGADIVPDGQPVHLLGWSMGAGVVMRYAIDHPGTAASVTLVSPLSPFGFGGTRDLSGTLTYEDGAGTGAGTVSAELVERLRSGDASDASPMSARSLLRNLYLKPPYRLAAELEDALVDEILATAVGEANYPGDHLPSGHWPGVAPGTTGVVNAMSPLYCDLSDFSAAASRTCTLWVRGRDDQMVADRSMLDLAVLGELGLVPGWPGPAAFPAQPMVSQMRAVLRRGEQQGGKVVESVFTNCSHSPHLEQPERFRQLLVSFVSAAAAARW
ncbi:MAG TPA: alpha/beta fold hydrolase [Acidimicrobiales bacterium]|nr:alpha/beta fold hydrolase [Acidimicrobiales bacterium]